MQIFEYAVLVEELKNKDGDVTEPAEIIVPVTNVLARDLAQANMIAVRAIPDGWINKLDRIKVAVRPF